MRRPVSELLHNDGSNKTDRYLFRMPNSPAGANITNNYFKVYQEFVISC